MNPAPVLPPPAAPLHLGSPTDPAPSPPPPAFLAPSPAELEHLCAERPLASVEAFSGNAFYGMAEVLKRYAGLPPERPLPGVLPHGAHCASNIWEEELRHPLPHVLLWSEEQRELYARATRKTLHVIGSPLLYAARLIAPELDELRHHAAGTLVFPVHSTHHLTARYDEGELIARIAELPEAYQPIRICLYWRDVQLGRHRRWQDAGFTCVSAGHMFDPEFPFRLLRLVSSHRRAAANGVGTAVLCASVLGLPVKMLRQPSSHDGSEARYVGELASSLDLPVATAFHESADLPLDQAAERQRPLAHRAFGSHALHTPADLRHLIESLHSHPPTATPAPTPPSTPATLPSAATHAEALTRLLPTLAPQVAQHPRRHPGQLDLGGHALAYADFHSLYYQTDQIFRSRLYEVDPGHDQPFIIDGGAHVGLAALFFAARHPRAVIHAFEADPAIARLLARNVTSLGLHQVTVHPQALWTHAEGVAFDATADDSGQVRDSGALQVPSVRLRDLLQRQTVDLLKLDVEGAEYSLLCDCDGALDNVRHVVIEVHHFRDDAGSLGSLLAVLERNGFAYTLGDLHHATWVPAAARPPFAACPTPHYLVTVFAWRPTPARRTPARPSPAAPATSAPLVATTAIAEGVQALNGGRLADALTAFDRAQKLLPKGHRVAFARALTLARAGRRDEARTALAALTSRDPAFAKARQLLVELTIDES